VGPFFLPIPTADPGPFSLPISTCDPNDVDSDGDGMNDGWEYQYGLDPTIGQGVHGASGDYDKDGLDNYTEYTYGLDPTQDSEGNSWSESEIDNQTGDIIKEIIYQVYEGQVVTLNATMNSYDDFGRVYLARQMIDAGGNPNDPNNRITLNVYDVRGNVITAYLKGPESDDPNILMPEPDDLVTENTYDSLGRLTETRDPNYFVTKYIYNAKGQLWKVEREGVVLSENIYDGAGRVIKVINAESHYRTYSYDSLNQVIREIAYEEDGAIDIELMQVRTQYDGLGHVVLREVMADPADMTAVDSVNFYEGEGYKSVNMVAEYIYDPCEYPYPGMLTSQKTYYGGEAEDEAVSEYFYDGLGRRNVSVDPNDNYTQLYYDVMNRVEIRQQFDEDESVVTAVVYEYDTLGRMVEQRQVVDTGVDYGAAGNYLPTTYTYDGAGRLLLSVDAKGFRSTYKYDNFNQRVKQTADAGGIGQDTEYVYDRLGRQAAIKGYAEVSTPQITTYDYDKLNNVTKITYPDLAAIEYDFNYNGTVSKRVDQRGIITLYSYDNLGKIEEKLVFPQGSLENEPNIVEEFAYNGVGLMISAEKYYYNPLKYVSDTEFEYNGLGKITLAKEKIFGAETAVEIGYTYDQAGNLVEITYPEGTVYKMSREALGRIAAITDDDEETPYVYADYEYMGLRVGERGYPEIGDGGVDYEISYNDLGRAERHYTHDGASTIVDFNYTFDDNGNITGQEFAHRTASPDNDYTYDDLDRLTDVTYHDSDTEWFDYDKLGNRVEAKHRDSQGELTYARNSLTNRYDSEGTFDIESEYDDAGNTTKDPNNYEYEYDYENRIVKITKGEADIAEYVYDALGRRIQKFDVVADETIRYYYNDNWQVLTETDGNGDTQRRYIYGNYIDEVLVMVAPNEPNDYYYTHDHLYSPVALMNDSGDVVERYEYDAYGKPYFMDAGFNLLEVQESAYNNPYGFTGRRIDIHDNGNLVKQNSRMRDLEFFIGRFFQTDPIGYINGLNLYMYVLNNPIIGLDPYGLMNCKDECKKGEKGYEIIQWNAFPYYMNNAKDWYPDKFTDIIDLIEKFNYVVDKAELAAAVWAYYQSAGTLYAVAELIEAVVPDPVGEINSELLAGIKNILGIIGKIQADSDAWGLSVEVQPKECKKTFPIFGSYKWADIDENWWWGTTTWVDCDVDYYGWIPAENVIDARNKLIGRGTTDYTEECEKMLDEMYGTDYIPPNIWDEIIKERL